MRIFLLFLLMTFLTPQLHSQTDNNAPCWGATLNTDFDYNGSDELQKTYTANEIGIYFGNISSGWDDKNMSALSYGHFHFLRMVMTTKNSLMLLLLSFRLLEQKNFKQIE